MTELSASAVANAVSRDIAGELDRVHTHINKVENKVEIVNDNVESIGNTLSDLKQTFEEYVELDRRQKAVMRAETVLGNLEADLDRKYGHYRLVRRSAIGTLQAFDSGIITNQTVQRITEELMVQTPNYWLAPAIVALAAWSRDDQELANKAVDIAFSRDSLKCSLFFALVLQRQNRYEGAAKWITHYLRLQDKENLTREFAVIMEALACGAFGVHGQRVIEETVDHWLADLREDATRVDNQVALWREETASFAGVTPKEAYRALRAFSPTWPQIKAQIESAAALENMRTEYQRIKDSVGDLGGSDRENLDNLLENLVREYDTEELPLRKEVIFNKTIVETNGNIKEAKRRSDLKAEALGETIDALTLETHTAISPQLCGVSVGTQQISISACKSEWRQGVSEFCAHYRQNAVNAATIQLNTNHSEAAKTFDFPGWIATTSDSSEQAESSLASTWQLTIDNYREQIKFKPMKYMVHGVIFAIALIVSFAIAAGFGLFILLVGGGGLGFYIWRAKKTADLEIATLEQRQNDAYRESERLYHETVAEFTDSMMHYEDADSREPDLRKLIDQWPTYKNEMAVN